MTVAFLLGTQDIGTHSWWTESVFCVIGRSSYTEQVSKSTCQIRKHGEDTRAFTIYTSKRQMGKRKNVTAGGMNI